jgi:hypothetical protein
MHGPSQVTFDRGSHARNIPSRQVRHNSYPTAGIAAKPFAAGQNPRSRGKTIPH